MLPENPWPISMERSSSALKPSFAGLQAICAPAPSTEARRCGAEELGCDLEYLIERRAGRAAESSGVQNGESAGILLALCVEVRAAHYTKHAEDQGLGGLRLARRDLAE